MPFLLNSTALPHQTEINVLLKKLLNRFFLLFIIAGLLSLTGSTIRASQSAWTSQYVVQCLLFISLIAAYFIFKNHNPQIFALALFSIVALDAIVNFFTFGLAGTAPLQLVYIAIMTATFFTMEAGVLTMFFSLLMLLFFAVSITTGWMQPSFDLNTFATSWTIWVTQILTFCVLTATAIASTSTIKKCLHHSLQTLEKQRNDLSQTNHELLESQHTINAIIDTAPEAIITASLNGIITSCNEQARQLFNYPTQDKLIGTDLFTSIPEKHTPKIRHLLSNMISQSVSCRDIEFEVLSNAEKTTPVKMSAGILFSQDKMPTGFLIIIQDISEAKEIEEHLRQSEKMEAIGQLAGGIAHDFNNQLTGILGFGELLRANLVNDPENLEEINAIIQTAKKASELTQQLLMFSRKGIKKSEPFDLHHTVHDVELLLKRTLKNSVTVTCSTNARNSIIHGDATQIQSVLLNLALNARDAMPEGGTITITTWNRTTSEIVNFFPVSRSSVQKPYIILSVKDTGTGISKEVQRRIFEPFFTTKEAGKGTGMGLANAYSTIKNHGGRIEVNSKPGQGTEMKLFFPEHHEG